MRTINLDGPEGNAFALLAHAKRLGIQLGMMRQQIEAIQTDMKSGNYQHLVEVFDRHFGEVVDLIMPEPEDEEDEA